MFRSINIFGKEITWYSLCALIGFLIVFAFHQIYTKKRGHDEILMLFILLFSMIGVLIGSHLLYAATMYNYIVLFFQSINSIDSFKTLFEWLITIFGGSVFYGGLFGGVFVAWLYMRKQKVDHDPYIGIGTLCIPLFHFFGRIGCFLSGCCYGIESEFGLIYHYSSAPDCNGVSRFPVQLLEAFFLLLIFIILFILFDKKKKTGKSIFELYLLMYSIVRFFLEFLRGDEYRGFIGIFSTSQIISIIIILVVFIKKIIINKRKSTILM